MNFDPVGLKDLVFLISPIPSGSYSLSAFSSTDFLSSEGKDLMETYHERQNVLRSLICCVMFSYGSLSLFPFMQE